MDDAQLYQVIASCEDEYTVWPVVKRVPSAWRSVDVRGTRDECAAYIRHVETTSAAEVRRIVERAVVRP